MANFITHGVNIEEKLGSPSFKPSKKTNEGARKGYWAEVRWPHSGARALHLAMEFGHDDISSMLVTAGAKLEEGDGEGWRALHYAAFNCRPAMVRLLLDKGASPHATSDAGQTPFDLGFRESGIQATDEEKESIIEMLQLAMTAQKPPFFKSFTGLLNTANEKKRVIAARNKYWHTAELAANLQYNFEDDETEETDSLEPSQSASTQKSDQGP